MTNKLDLVRETMQALSTAMTLLEQANDKLEEKKDEVSQLKTQLKRTKSADTDGSSLSEGQLQEINYHKGQAAQFDEIASSAKQYSRTLVSLLKQLWEAAYKAERKLREDTRTDEENKVLDELEAVLKKISESKVLEDGEEAKKRL